MVRRLLSVSPRAVVYPLLPAKELNAIPAPPHLVDRGLVGGRSIYEGASRSMGIEFGNLYQDICRDPLYREARALSRGRSVVSVPRQMNLFLILRFYLSKLASRNIVELGTWRGGNVLFMARILKEIDPAAKVYGLDTFAGMPATRDDVDAHRAGDFVDTDMKQIELAAKKARLSNIVLIKGDIRDTLPSLCERETFGLSHIDLDIYDPIAEAQNILLKKMIPGGYLVYDDATVSSCPGATLAVEELISLRNMRSEQIYPHFVFRAPS